MNRSEAGVSRIARKGQPMVFVAGHRRPDTDAAVAAVVAARLRARTHPERSYHPLLLGKVGLQTSWLFEQAGVDLPPIRDDIRWTVGELMHPPTNAIRPNDFLGDALRLLRSHDISVVAVTDEDGVMQGIISDRLQPGPGGFHFNAEDYLGELLDFHDLVEGLELEALNRAPLHETQGGSFRVALHGMDALRRSVMEGDVVIAGHNRDAVEAAALGKAMAVVLVDCKHNAAAELARNEERVPIYLFRGTAAGLLTSLSLAIRASRVMVREFDSLQPDQPLDEVRQKLASSPHSLPVVDDWNRLVGIFSRHAALEVPRRPVILVDHFEQAQAVTGLEHADVIEIIDHHRLGNIETMQPLTIDCRPIGSTASILACKFREAGLEPSAAEAKLLLGAMISDTLKLTSPTTTAVDREMAQWLTELGAVEFEMFGKKLLELNDELATGEPESLVEKDLKEFQQADVKFGVAQLETVDLGLLTQERTVRLMRALEGLRGRLGVAFVALMVTDVLKGCSRVLVSDDDEGRRVSLFGMGAGERAVLLQGVVSRKKQLLPMVLDRLQRWGREV